MSEVSISALAAKVDELEKRLQQREDELDVRKLQFLYGYLIDKCMYDQVIELFTDDCEVRFFGGVYKGKAGARRLYIERFRKRFTHNNNGPVDGFLLDHPQLQDIVDIEPDGVTAQAARALDHAGRAPPDYRRSEAAGLGVRQWWEGGIYENTYKKGADGKWRIHVLNYFPHWHADFDNRAGPIPTPNMCPSPRRSIPMIRPARTN